MVIDEEKADAQSGCAIAVRNDVLEHYKLNVKRVARHWVEIGLRDVEKETRVASAYIPPRYPRRTTTRRWHTRTHKRRTTSQVMWGGAVFNPSASAEVLPKRPTPIWHNCLSFLVDSSFASLARYKTSMWARFRR